MTPEQRTRLTALVPKMRTMARRKVSPNDFRKADNEIDVLVAFLAGWPTERTADEWLAIAEKAAEGHDTPGTIRMTMAQVLSGMPPEHKGENA